jgi:predicted translin family RNA/ssDNA-binding protein
MIEDFGKIYDLQDAGKSFTNISALLSAMNKEFPKLLQISITDQFLQTGFTKKLIDELVEAAIVINYGQETNIQSFVSLVALAGVDADLWSVKGGNKAVKKYIIELS